jgi:hypothetical protein
MTSGLNGQAAPLCEFCCYRHELNGIRASHEGERTTMETSGGGWLDLGAPDPADIKLRDIARSLSLVCRFGGHVPFHWSVADHALLVRRLVIEAGYPELALAALHHDSHEAYTGDIPTPLKVLFGAVVDQLVGELDEAIAQALHLDANDFNAEPVHEADQLALRIEAWHLKPSRGIENAWPWREPPPKCVALVRRLPDETAAAFVGAHVGDWQPVRDRELVPYA